MKRKKKFSFPTAYTVILAVMLIVLLLTYVIPSGKYSTLSYVMEGGKFVVEDPFGGQVELEGTQKTLDELGIKINIGMFKDGAIIKPVAIPGSYKGTEKENKSIINGIVSFFKAPVEGLYDSIDIITFVLVIGGIVGVVNKSGAFTAGINSLSKILKGKEKWLIVLITILIGIGGTTFGLAEEIIAFYPIVIPVFLASGYDALVAIAAVYLGSAMGSMASTVNPFATVIASNTAGINFTDGIFVRISLLVLGLLTCIIYVIRYAEKVKKDPSKSLIYSQKEEIDKQYLISSKEDTPKFTFGRKAMLIIFVLSFGIMIYGVKELGWWFQEMTALFLGVTFIMYLFAGLKEKEFVNEFVLGASDLLGVALIIGLARGVTIIMEKGMISDTILFYLSKGISGMSGVVFSTVIFFVYIILGFFIASSSGLAVLSIPIMAPLADIVGVNRDIIVSAYEFGQGLMGFITPTGLILASLAMVNITYDKWLKFILPLMIMIGVLAIVVLGFGVIVG